MPTVNLNKQALEKMLGKKLSLEELKDRISMLGTDLEKIEGNEIIVEVFPNRPDMLCETGFARALSSFVGSKTGLKKYEVKKAKDSEKYKVIIDKSVEEVRPFTSCAIVKRLKLDDQKIKEIIQLQEKLHITFARNRKKLAIGIYPLEKINLPITYSAKKPEEIKFRPLESDKILTAKQILETHPTGKEFAHLLEGKKLYPLFSDAKGNILSMPPIINSHETGRVIESTKDVFVECSGFDKRVLDQCLNIIVSVLSDLDGEIYEMTLESGKNKTKTPDLSPKEWKVDLKYLNKIIGVDFSEKEIKELLEKMGLSYDIKKKKVLVPAYRTDILHQIDLAEEIAIAYGYENFKPIIPDVMTIGQENNLEIFKNRIADLLSSIGLVELNTYHLTNKEIHNIKMLQEDKLVELENSKTSDRIALRNSLLPSSMQILGENTSKEYPQGLFELGITFSYDDKTETGVLENQKLAIILASPESDFTTSKQMLESITKNLGLEFELNKSDKKTFIIGRQATVLIDKKEVGFIGEIHPQVLENFKVQMPTCALEIDIGKIYELVMKKLN